MTHKNPLSLGLVFGLPAFALAAAALMCAAVLALAASQGELRCYELKAPLNRMERMRLADRPAQCVDGHCWAVARLGHEHGLGCFYDPGGRRFTPSEGTTGP
ncbi:MAG: hypothetical protein ACT4QE_10170 [Anaerolineales bacterium]